MKNKLILTDADGVCLDWLWAFKIWMQDRGFTLREGTVPSYRLHTHFNEATDRSTTELVKVFNESAAIGFLPAFKDAVHYIRLLHEEHGYVFRVITSLSSDPSAARLREMNLRHLFGSAIENIVMLDTGAEKYETLTAYKNSGLWWIEDKPSNADAGHELGLNSILVRHDHNSSFQCPYPVVDNWKEIYQIITAADGSE